MTPEQIETLKKMADEQDKYSREWDWIADHAKTPAQAWEDRRKAAMYQAQAAALRAALALAEERQAMEGWTFMSPCERVFIHKNYDGSWVAHDEGGYRFISVDGKWSRTGPHKFQNLPAAIAAANKAIGGGK